MNIKRLFPFISIALALFLSFCEKEDDAIVDPGLSPPFIISVTSSDSALHLDTTTSAAVTRLPNNRFRISGSISAKVADPNGLQDLRQVNYRLYEPRSSDYITSGVLGYLDTSYSASFSFTISRSEAGIFRFEVYAQDRDNLTSNFLQIPLVISRNNSRPHTSGIVAPDTLVRPSSGIALVLFSVAAEDSDGYGDIEEVFFKRISPSSSGSISMLDNGNQQESGDQLAGDGIFSRIVRIDSTALLGNQVFLFHAKDNAGALSDSLTHTVTIIMQSR
ncbi:MAG TPA: hypothetical protein VGR15_11015 [Bacteroidota bacterium]|jgi:hypothetical protein|nr:hypothetical protein [Bacteroidota bacterium]